MRKLVLFVLVIACSMAFGQNTKARTAGLVAHGINLTYTDSCVLCAINLYRGTSPGGESYATPLLTAQPGVLTFLDTTGVANTKYYYTTTNVLGGIESAPSNEAFAIFPTVPAPPAGLVAVPQ